MPSSPRHFVDLWRFDAPTLRAILDDAHARKAGRIGWPRGRVDPDAPGAYGATITFDLPLGRRTG